MGSSCDAAADSQDKEDGGAAAAATKKGLGAEFVKSVRMQYCDLCRKFLPRPTQDKSEEDILADHCQGQNHVVLYKSRNETATESKADDSTRASSPMPDEDDLDYEL